MYVAHKVGADSVKVQMYEPDGMADNNDGQIQDGPWKGQTLHELYEKAAMPLDWVVKLKNIADGLGLGFIASVYYPEMVEFAEQIGIRTYKIASYELLFDKLIETVANTGKPVIISTGGGALDEVEHALQLVRNKHDKVALLKCTSSYPASLESMNLHTILDMRKRFRCPIGLSDHSLGCVAPVAACVLGARVIEKHITLDSEQGVDAGFSITPDRFDTMVRTIRATQISLGSTTYGGPSQYRRKQVNGRWLRSV